MDIGWVAMILLGAVGTGRMEAAGKIAVDVYVQKENWPQPLQYAQAQTTGIFKGSGVRVIWHAGDLPAARCAGRPCIGIRMAAQAPASLTPLALATARPYGTSGTLIDIYADRVRPALNEVSDVLLAYIFAHELAHVMVGSDYHSDSGILKAQWSYADHVAMRMRRLRFTAGDSERIREGLTDRRFGK